MSHANYQAGNLPMVPESASEKNSFDGARTMHSNMSTACENNSLLAPVKQDVCDGQPSNLLFTTPYILNMRNVIVPGQTMDAPNLFPGTLFPYSGTRAPISSGVSCLPTYESSRSQNKSDTTISDAVASSNCNNLIDAGVTEEEINELIERVGDDIDLILDERAEKNKLTVKNVKSILKHVITNPYVLAMVRNTMKGINGSKGEDLEEAVFEPKLTRSKAKELREKQEVLPWPVSTPVKQNKEITNKLLFGVFSDDEGSSDEEYHPNEEELHSGEDESFLEKKKPPLPIEFYPPDEDGLVIADVESFLDDNLPSNQTDRIALRTRSKLPLTDTPLEKIEASFIAPDITLDMYETVIDDADWQTFLLELNKPLEEKDSNDQQDDDDPEYNVMEVVEEEREHDEEQEDEENSACITKEEMNALMSEIFMEELLQMEDEGLEQQNVEQIPEEIPHAPEETNMYMTAYEKHQFEMQMRMHVQLLCQSFLLSQGTEAFAEINKTSATLLEELKQFASVASDDDKVSPFCTHNLDEAVSIVHAFQMPDMPTESQESRIPGTKRKLTAQMKNFMAHSKVFIYPRLLPRVAYQLDPSTKAIFTKAEDNLIILGWIQFDYAKSNGERCNLIKSLLLPTKTVHQIKLRIKNRKSRSAPEDNPIRRYFKYGELPVIPRMLGNFNPLLVKAPCDMSADVLPPWMATFITKPALVPLAPQPPSEPAPGPVRLKRLQTKLKPISPKPRKYSPILPRGFVSPMKKITTILRKYGHHRRALHMTPLGTIFATKTPNPVIHRPIRPKPVVDESLTFSKSCNDVTASVIASHNETLSVEVPISDSLTTEVMFIPMVNVEDLCNRQQSSDLPLAAQMQIEEKADVEMASPDKPNAKDGQLQNAMVVDLDTQEDVEDEVADDEEDLAALMAASSTICRKTSIIKKKNKHQRDLESTLALLSPTLMESDPKKEQREKLFAQSYLSRVMEALKNEPETAERFLKLLSSYEFSNKSSLQLFSEVNDILKDHPTLVDDFVGFLLPEQAKVCGKYLQYRTLYKIREFFRKLEVHFTHQPHHIQRILRAFSQLQQQADITSASVLAILQPLLRNQTHLLEEFMQLLPDSTPPECMMTDFEEVEIPNSGDEKSCDSFEEIIMPDVPDPYGGKDCPCTCHIPSSSDGKMQNRNRHCVKCGTKFIDGRIYIQTGKVLKPAQVIYHKTMPSNEQGKEKVALGDEKADTKNPQTSNVGNENRTNASKAILLNSESSEVDKQTSTISSELRHMLKATLQEESRTFPKPGIIRQGICDALASDCVSPLPCDVIEDAVLLPDARNISSSIPSDFSCLSQVISPRPIAESNNFTILTQNYSPIASVKEKVPTTPSAFNLSFLSSVITEPVPAQNDVSVGPSEDQLWTREQDKVILEACQKHGTNPETFVEISTMIPTKSSLQIKNRFYELMELVKRRLSSNR